MTTSLGIDGCSSGWLAVVYEGRDFRGIHVLQHISQVPKRTPDSDEILIDIPIGLREESGEPRGCDRAARDLLSPHRHASVFPVPVRETAHQRTYRVAKRVQERETAGSLSAQSWALCEKISQLDRYLLEGAPPDFRPRESHPEVCFATLNGGDPMRHSKTGEPEVAVRERIEVLREVDPRVPEILDRQKNSTKGFETHDLLDAWVLALTACPRTGSLKTMPGTPETDPRGLPM